MSVARCKLWSGDRAVWRTRSRAAERNHSRRAAPRHGPDARPRAPRPAPHSPSTMQTSPLTRPPRGASADVARPARAARRPRLTVGSAQQEAAAAVVSAEAADSPAAAHPAQTAACVELVRSLGGGLGDAAAADAAVARAFGWGRKAKAFWRHEKSRQAPDAAQVAAALQFLRGLGMSDEQLLKAVQAFPEVLGCDVEQQLQGNVAKLQKDWRLEGSVLLGAVCRQPAVLGYNLDCGGDCAGECNRCWARF